jgi:hypothetical protein
MLFGANVDRQQRLLVRPYGKRRLGRKQNEVARPPLVSRFARRPGCPSGDDVMHLHRRTARHRAVSSMRRQQESQVERRVPQRRLWADDLGPGQPMPRRIQR